MTLSSVLWPVRAGQQPGAVAFVGAGGKTSAMALLARESPEMRNPDFPIVLTTTTKLQRPCPVAAGIVHVGYRAPSPALLAKAGPVPVLWVGESSENGSKWLSPPLSAIEQFIETASSYVLVEADGAAGRPIKTAGDHEPVLPGNITTVVAVLGMEGLGLKAEAASVHRLEPFLNVSGLTEGDRITVDALEMLVRHPREASKAHGNLSEVRQTRARSGFS